jgi:CheY-like chemotaxis protein
MMNHDRPLQGLSLLVVEDEEDTRELLAFILEEAGAQVTAFTYVYQALAAFDGDKPDVLLSNVYLLDGDGFEFLEAWRRREAQLGHATTPAILVTESTRDVPKKKLQRAGFQAYITRPFEIEDIIEIVADVAQQIE